VGKTTFLLHFLSQSRLEPSQKLYVSADNLYFVEHSLVSLVDQFVKELDGQLIAIDEIHKYQNWNQELKNIYDSYPQINILFSGSSSIDLVKGKYDLSRRALLHHMFGFSFREYLEFTLHQSFKKYSLEELTKNHISIANKLALIPKMQGHFKTYLERGYYPFSHKYKQLEHFAKIIIGMIEKTIYEDIASFYSLKTQNLEVFKKILYFIATTKPGSMSINQLANSLSKDHTTTAEYLQILKDTGLLLFLMNEKTGHALIRNAEKVYLDNPNLSFAINHSLGKKNDVGNTREEFVLSQLLHAAYVPFYTKQGDFKCNAFTFEVGGKGKSDKQVRNVDQAFVIKDNILIGDKKNIPLYLFGFLS